MSSLITKERVMEALKEVIDPELNINIVDLGLIYDVLIEEKSGEVGIVMTLTTPGCPLSMVFEEWIPVAVKKIDGVKSVMIDLTWEPPWNPDNISEDMKEQLGIIK